VFLDTRSRLLPVELKASSKSLADFSRSARVFLTVLEILGENSIFSCTVIPLDSCNIRGLTDVLSRITYLMTKLIPNHHTRNARTYKPPSIDTKFQQLTYTSVILECIHGWMDEWTNTHAQRPRISLTMLIPCNDQWPPSKLRAAQSINVTWTKYEQEILIIHADVHSCIFEPESKFHIHTEP
jgi:hypothetical protein